ncbi:alpha-amylase family glycosyl hydrolase [Olleya aquimaris]|uniref:Sucrose phosphorylase n=1 Tax=Olleya aquimaris TaxID=639310 RepID=A0A327RQJ6_9FLAO|nr:glycosidase [Olleya aquimaris]RAJ18232.1 sucrose phosphorylase [Olleya aquimaris]
MPTSTISNGVMLNAYPDSIGEKWSDTISMLQRTEFKDVFSLFYVLPTFFNSDLDRGFSIIDYNLNKDLIAEEDLKALNKLNIKLKFDIVLNHLSVASPQFKDLLKHGDQSKYKDFFINWNTFWQDHGDLNEEEIVIPKKQYLDKLFMRKAGLPILKVPFPDGSEQPYWNTFYQEIKYHPISIEDLKNVKQLSSNQAKLICDKVNQAIQDRQDISTIDFGTENHLKTEIIDVVNKKRTYLGQMDVNAKSPLVWDFYEDTLSKVKSFGGQILRLDAFAYLHKQVGQSNFFNKPGTWQYLERIKQIAQKNNLMLLPEIHAEYGLGLHEEVANKGYFIYDFFLPGLVIHTLETANNKAILKWANEIITKGYKTVNMLGCHDGIPVLDLKGKEVNGSYNKGLLEDEEIETIMNTIIERGGRVKNLYGPSGKKISYYQVNATFFSALGEDEQKMLLARAIQLFMPGIPQIWYLDIFEGKNNYEAADKAGSGGHKEINRTTLSLNDINKGLKKQSVLNQLEIIKLRNTSKAFQGEVSFNNTSKNIIDVKWENEGSSVHLNANLKTFSFNITCKENNETKVLTY